MKDYERITTKRLGELLLDKGVITQEQLNQALEQQKKKSGRLGQILVDLKFVKEEDILIALTAQYGYPYLPLENYQIDSQVAALVPEELARKYCLIPIDRIGDVLTVAMVDPLDEEALKLVEETTGCKIQVFVSTSSDIIKAIKQYY